MLPEGPARGARRAGRAMSAEQEDLDALSTQELHDRAVQRARRHLDVKFFWSLLQLIPTAETASGDEGEADYDIQRSTGLIYDALRSGDGSARGCAAARVHRLPAQAS